MTRSLSRFGWVALVVAWAVDFLFWKKPAGVSYFIWVALALLGLAVLALIQKKRLAPINWLLITAALIMAFFTFFRAEPFTLFINGVMAFGALLLLGATFENGYWLYYRIVDYIVAGFWLVVSSFSRPLDLAADQSVPTNEEALQKPKTGLRQVLPLLRGFLIAVPVLAILGGLLSTADPIFADSLKNIFDFGKLGEYILRLSYILVLAYLFTGTFLHALNPKREESKPDETKFWVKPFIGWTETTVVLVLVDLLFLLFVVIQFRYFFGGQANITAAGYTYADYARRGFGELVAVAIISLLLYLGLAASTRLEKNYEQGVFTGLSLTLMLLVMVMLVSAFQRLMLYETAYGFSRLRTYPHVLMVWLGISFFAAMLFEILRRRRWVVTVLLVASFGFALSLGALNVDGLIASQNIARARNGAELDVDYIKVLSDDAVPVLIEQYNNPALSQQVRDQIGSNLACRAAQISNESPLPWQSFRWSHTRAANLLKQNQVDLNQYLVTNDQGWFTVIVNGEVQDCTSYANLD